MIVLFPPFHCLTLVRTSSTMLQAGDGRHLAPDLWRENFHPSLLSMMLAMGVSQMPFISEEAPFIPNLPSVFYHEGC